MITSNKLHRSIILKPHLWISLAILAIPFGCYDNEVKNSLLKLKIIEGNYPRAFFFRASEQTRFYDGYEQWEDTFDDLYGFIGQALPYQRLDHVPGDLDKNPSFFTRFKQDNPGQKVQMHLATNAHDPRAQPLDFFAGHWLYYNGAKIHSDVPAKAGTSEIKVSDARLFHLNIGFTGDRAEDIGLCKLDNEGRPNWNEAEQVQLLSVDTINHIITVDRCQYGTAPIAFDAGHAYAASHVHNGPWQEKTHLAWSFNYSTHCPLDKQERNCSDRIVEYLGRELGAGGLVYNIDGLAFDVVWMKPRVNPGQAFGRLPDFDADGRGDDYTTDITYPIGVIDFFRKLRVELGEERIITSDCMDLDHQRAFGILNGMESEGFPKGNDPFIKDWSGGMNRLLFWNQNGREPVYSYINYKYFRNIDRSGVTINYPRLVMAASTFANTSICMNIPPGDFVDRSSRNERRNRFQQEIWDELVMGKDQKLGWLGKPLEPAIHMARRKRDLLGGAGSPPEEALLNRLVTMNTSSALEEGSIRVESPSAEIRFQIPDIPCDGSDMTVFITARAATRNGFPPEYARLLILSANQPGLPYPGPLQHHLNEKNRFATFVNEQEFTSFFNFSKLEASTVTLEILIEAGDPVWITGIEVFSHPDAMYREFENGLVLANPTDAPYTFDLEALLPGQAFRRINGNEDQDPVHNDGSTVKTPLTLRNKDAIFLVKVN